MDIASLLSDPAQEFILEHQHDDPAALMLSNKNVPGIPLRELVSQIKARSSIRNKIPSWYQTPGMIYGDSKSLEQSSSEVTAEYKSRLIAGKHLVDLTGGLGVDSFFMGKKFDRVTYIEKDVQLCQLVANNFKALGARHTRIFQGAAEEVLREVNELIDWIFIDPDRRPDQKRRFRLEQCQPSIPLLLPKLWKMSHQIMIKLSPMLDIWSAMDSLKNVSQVHVISVKNDCKELVFVLEKEFKDDVQFSGINFLSDGTVQTITYSQAEETNSRPQYSEPLKYLYEPNSSILKLGAFKLLGTRFDLKKLHPNSHLYTSHSLMEGFPGRSFKIQWKTKYKPGHLRNLIPGEKANIAVRNFVKDVSTIRKECGIKEGGEDYIFATTGPKEQLMVINGHKI